MVGQSVLFDDFPRACSRSSGVKSIKSSSLRPCISKAGGLVTKGCVGQVFSPGTSDWGTGRSSMGQIGSPVSRLKTKASLVWFLEPPAAGAGRRHVDVHDLGGDRIVHVPDIVMDHLVVPALLSRLGVQSQQTGAVQIGARPVSAVVVPRRSVSRDKDQTAFRIGRQGGQKRCFPCTSRNRLPRYRVPVHRVGEDMEVQRCCPVLAS